MSAVAAAKAIGPDAEPPLPKPKRQARNKVPEAAPPTKKPQIKTVAITEAPGKEGKLGKGKGWKGKAMEAIKAVPKRAPGKRNKWMDEARKAMESVPKRGKGKSGQKTINVEAALEAIKSVPKKRANAAAPKRAARNRTAPAAIAAA